MVVALVGIVAVSCSSMERSQAFLRTDDEGWNRWLDQPVSYSVTNTSVQNAIGRMVDDDPHFPTAFITHPPCHDLTLSLSVTNRPRREILQLVEQQCGVHMRWGGYRTHTNCIVIKKK